MKYNGNGKIISSTDRNKNVKYEYEYNKQGNLECIYKTAPYYSSEVESSTKKYVEYYYHNTHADNNYPNLLKGYAYSETGRVYSFWHRFYDGKISLDGENTGISVSSFGTENLSFDEHSRISNRTVKNNAGTVLHSETYNYDFIPNTDNSVYSTKNNQPNRIELMPRGNEDMHEISYWYDGSGNIISVNEYGSVYAGNGMDGQPVYDQINNESHEYEYDKLNRLVKEVFDNKEYRYVYDEAGNILQKEKFTNNILDKTYVYEYNNSRWGDQLTGITINGDSQSFTYNTIGLPTVYRGKSLGWNRRNQLNLFNGTSFTYDASGMRLTKNSITYEYVGNNLIKETRGTDVIEYVDGTSGKLGFVYNNVPYYYIRNVLGDVKGILDANGNLVAEYKYDAWGNHKVFDSNGNDNSSSTFIGNINPIRYRGYYYDTETNLYYLETRYYDPEIGRFISPDSTKYLDPDSLGGLNLYTYCLNNPVMYADPSGNSLIAAILIGAIIGAGIGFGATAYQDYKDDGEIFNGSISAASYIANTVVGGVIGGTIGAFAGGAGASIGNAISSFLSNSYSFAMPNLVSGGALVLGQVTGAQIAGVAAGVAGLVMLSTTSNRNGYWGQRYPIDHAPEHIHFKGTDGTDIRIGKDGNPLKGEPKLKPQAKKALKKLWKEILQLFEL